MNSTGLFIVISSLLLCLSWWLWRRWRVAMQAEYIRRYTFPAGLLDRFRKRRPELCHKDCELTGRALRQFFLAYLHGGREFVSMPSQLADDLWHEFILYTRHYDLFCRKAFGGFLHHTPAVVLSKDRHNNSGLRRIWWYCCREENINPRKPSRLPLLFALDGKLKIADGFIYRPDCEQFNKLNGDQQGSVHCGADFASFAFDGSTDGFGDSYNDIGSDSGGDGDGGGGSCGGGGD